MWWYGKCCRDWVKGAIKQLYTDVWEHLWEKVWKKSEIIWNAWKDVLFNALKVWKWGFVQSKKVWNQIKIWTLTSLYMPSPCIVPHITHLCPYCLKVCGMWQHCILALAFKLPTILSSNAKQTYIMKREGQDSLKPLCNKQVTQLKLLGHWCQWPIPQWETRRWRRWIATALWQCESISSFPHILTCQICDGRGYGFEVT